MALASFGEKRRLVRVPQELGSPAELLRTDEVSHAVSNARRIGRHTACSDASRVRASAKRCPASSWTTMCLTRSAHHEHGCAKHKSQSQSEEAAAFHQP